MILFLHGPNSYLRQRRVRVLQEAFRKKFDTAGFSTSFIDGEQFTIDEFRKKTKSAGLFATKRFLIFTDLWKLNKADQDQLQETLAGIDSDTILCITADVPPRKDNSLFKQLLTADSVEEYTDLSHTQLRQFIQDECAEHNAQIDSPATQQLINAYGNDLWALAAQLHALAHYTKLITTEAVALFIEHSVDENIFALTDALGQKNTKRALQLFEEQLASGAHPQYLLVMIGRHMMTLAKVKKTGGKGLKMHSFVLQKAQQQAKQFSTERLLVLYEELLQIDHRVKSTTTDTRALLSQYILSACST